MSVAHWWFCAFITEGEHADLNNHFAKARRATSVPDDLEDPFDADRFELPDFGKLAETIIRGPLFRQWQTEERLFRFISIGRISPVAVLWHALGQDAAGRLPGMLGNLLVSHGDLASVADAVDDIHRRVKVRAAVARGYQLCAEEVPSSEVVRETVTFLPEGLAAARKCGMGFVSMALAEF
jgi:hypothetical protein